MPTKCAVCGEFFQKRYNPKQKTCSRSCNAIYQNKVKAKNFKCPICLICGKETKRSSRAKYCSRECHRISRIGAGNPMWNGGTTISGGGYRSILVKDHPLSDVNGRLLEHRYIMENWLKENAPDSQFLLEIEGVKCLRPKVIVHHKDGDKENNSIDNLELLESQGEHLKKHNFCLDYRSMRS